MWVTRRKKRMALTEEKTLRSQVAAHPAGCSVSQPHSLKFRGHRGTRKKNSPESWNVADVAPSPTPHRATRSPTRPDVALNTGSNRVPRLIACVISSVGVRVPPVLYSPLCFYPLLRLSVENKGREEGFPRRQADSRPINRFSDHGKAGFAAPLPYSSSIPLETRMIRSVTWLLPLMSLHVVPNSWGFLAFCSIAAVIFWFWVSIFGGVVSSGVKDPRSNSFMVVLKALVLRSLEHDRVLCSVYVCLVTLGFGFRGNRSVGFFSRSCRLPFHVFVHDFEDLLPNSCSESFPCHGSTILYFLLNMICGSLSWSLACFSCSIDCSRYRSQF